MGTNTVLKLSFIVTAADKFGVDHLSEDTLEEYVLGHLPGEQIAFVEEHLLVCELCRLRLESAETFITELRASLSKVPRRRSAWRNRLAGWPHECRKRRV
jgi:anti-sigma factor RsiW